MDFNVTHDSYEQHHSDCIIIGIFESQCLSPVASHLDKISAGYITSLLCRGELEGKVGQTLLLYNVPNIAFERILLVGCGKKDKLDECIYKQIINKTVQTINETGSIELLCFLADLNVKYRSIYWKIRQAVESAKESIYVFQDLKSDKKYPNKPLRKMIFNVPNCDDFSKGNHAIKHGLAISAGIKATKDLGNMPPNICNSRYLALKAKQLADSYNQTTTTLVIGEHQMKEIGMNAYLAVGHGSINESLMSIIKYNGHPDPKSQPIIIVGKGLTFDTGGVSIKHSENMYEMKYDMCGAATVYGIMSIAMQLNLPLNIIGVMACCENMLDKCAFRPGDVLTTLSGQTVEVLNTDAEGRLVLCDVLTYVERFNPEVVIDIATLTGACVIALGHDLTGLISNDDQLSNQLIVASEQAGDLAWRLPISNELQSKIKSNIADMSNIGCPHGGAIIAGYFLSRFTTNYNWAHLDIAGTAYRSRGLKGGATGRPVAMLAQFLLNRSGFKEQQY